MATESLYKVVLDSNFLLLPFQFRIDIFAELDKLLDVRYEVYVTKGVIEELKKIKSRHGKGALSVANKLRVIETEGSVDEALLKLASKEVIIATNDKFLKEKIEKKGAPVIYLRQRKYLAIDGYIR
ncbi:MAG: hypothetical protein QME59_00200 [Candidatus Hydrothermarchaeota archaeon]|nr:hypothetical protein [Candidatus Hydrothermarchaeota archaeon]